VLVVSRKENESIRIEPVEGLDPTLTLREAFAGGGIVVRLQHVGQRRIRLVIEAPPALRIMRSEALDKRAASPQPSTSAANPPPLHGSLPTPPAN
jgi:sRNA-binding carbon storage regulator CsrA